MGRVLFVTRIHTDGLIVTVIVVAFLAFVVGFLIGKVL